jgi:glucose-1-phosphate adenylyltransferase
VSRTGVEVKVSRPSSGVVANEIFVYRTEALLDALFELRRELSAEAARTPTTATAAPTAARRLRRAPPAPLISGGTVRTEPLPGYWRDLGRPARTSKGTAT